jgi:hypothetical protein
VLSASTLNGYKSAFQHWLCSEHGEKTGLSRALPTILASKLTTWLDGYKRKIADLKGGGVIGMKEGKDALSLDGYRLLAQKIFSLPAGRQVFAWPFFVLQWNLIARVDSVAKICYQHLQWKDDTLLVGIPRHKGDQDGSSARSVRIFANPLEPLICPILALGVQLLSRGSTRENLIFEGGNQDDRYTATLREVLSHLTDAEKLRVAHGERPGDIGSHSLRKGAATYVTGVMDGPQWLSVYVRAGWSVGDVQERYLKGEGGQDALAGRLLCGLDPTDQKFATLPPHFEDDVLESIPLFSYFTGVAGLGNAMKSVLPYLLASVIYHEKFLRDNLPADHRLWSSTLFTSGGNERLRGKAKIAEFHSADRKMRASGVPAHLMLMKTMREEMLDIKTSLEEKLREMLRKQDAQPAQLAEHILGRFEVIVKHF